MAKYPVSEDDSGPVFAMESVDIGMVKLSIRAESMLVSPDTADEIRTLLAVVIAEARGLVIQWPGSTRSPRA